MPRYKSYGSGKWVEVDDEGNEIAEKKSNAESSEIVLVPKSETSHEPPKTEAVRKKPTKKENKPVVKKTVKKKSSKKKKG